MASYASEEKRSTERSELFSCTKMNDMLTLALLAPPSGSHRTHTQTARDLAQATRGLMRRWRRTFRSPPHLHQRRQAPDLLVHVLRSPLRPPEE